VADCRKLLSATRTKPEELFAALRARLEEATPSLKEKAPAAVTPDQSEARLDFAVETPVVPPPPLAPPPPAPSGRHEGLEQLILKAAGVAPVRSIAEVRREMPTELQGQAFNEAVLRLADERSIVITQDCDASQLPRDERDGCVQDGNTLFTTIS